VDREGGKTNDGYTRQKELLDVGKKKAAFRGFLSFRTVKEERGWSGNKSPPMRERQNRKTHPQDSRTVKPSKEKEINPAQI